MIEGSIEKLKQLTRVVTVGLGLSWFELFGEIWKLGRKIMRGRANEGMYEVLDYETTLELKNDKGNEASLTKREKVRYLQENIIAFPDEAFGDGEILIDYKCSPGVLVDSYRLGHKTQILISLHSIKNKGDKDEFLIEWQWKDGFLASTGFWETRINHKTNRITVNVVFPSSRPPTQAHIVEQNQKRRFLLPASNKKKLPDGRWIISWKKTNPRIFENYLLIWEW